jgi:hypothetical protein
VFVPGAPIKKLRRAKEQIVDKEETHDDGQGCGADRQQREERQHSQVPGGGGHFGHFGRAVARFV